MFIRRRAKSSSGLTLIEVLISIIILAVALAGGVSIYFYLTAITTHTTHRTIAVQIANSKMEELRGMAYGNVTSVNWFAISLENLIAQESVTIIPYVNGYKEAQVAVTWQEPDKPISETVNLTTYIANAI